MTYCCVQYMYYITAAENSISSQLGSSYQGNWYGTEKGGVTTRPSHSKSHLPGQFSSSKPGGPPYWASLLTFRPHCVVRVPHIVRLARLKISTAHSHWVAFDSHASFDGNSSLSPLLHHDISFKRTVSRDGTFNKYLMYCIDSFS
jgi:hypothetical protein